MENILLFEVGTEEIPARYMSSVLSQFKNNFEKKLNENRIEYGKIECIGTPRRISLLVHEIEKKQKELEEKVKGPAKKIAFNENNEPSKALLGFLRGNNAKVEDIFFETVGKNEYVFAKKFDAGVETTELLTSLLPELILSIKFPKSMRWRDYELKFVRPIRWLVAMLNDKVIDIAIEGTKSSNCSSGHRTLSPGDIVIDNAKNYVNILRDSKIIVDQKEREEMILSQLGEIEKELDAKVLVEKDLLEEVIHLVEYPTAFYGTFDKEFLLLPKEVIITPMKDHQKYFPVTKNDKLLPNFVAVRNGESNFIDNVKKGNERVLAARLKDAEFFYNQDLKEKLETKVEKLKTIIYQAKLGTVYDKVQRVQSLSKSIGEKMGLDANTLEKLDRAAYLSKADLVTGLVCEFDELQGIIGREYALKNGEDKDVAEAIYSHYLPRYADDEMPTDKLGMIISLADKLDSIIGSYGIGVQPTGSQDPFGLRRQAIGIINILIKNGLKMDINFLFESGINLLTEKLTVEADSVKKDLGIFFKQRVKVIFNDNGFRYDVVDSILENKLEDVFLLKEKLKVLNEEAKTEEFKTLSTALSRCYNLAKKTKNTEICSDYFENDWEKNLYSAYNEIKDTFNSENIDYNGMTTSIKKLITPINDFFDNVMVMVEDEKMKNNRLALLKNIEEVTKKLCDFDKVIV